MNCFSVFVSMEHYNWSENSKMPLLLQIAAESFQTSPEFSSRWYSENCLGICKILKIVILNLFFIFASMGPKCRVKFTNATADPTNHSQKFSDFS